MGAKDPWAGRHIHKLPMEHCRWEGWPARRAPGPAACGPGFAGLGAVGWPARGRGWGVGVGARGQAPPVTAIFWQQMVPFAASGVQALLVWGPRAPFLRRDHPPQALPLQPQQRALGDGRGAGGCPVTRRPAIRVAWTGHSLPRALGASTGPRLNPKARRQGRAARLQRLAGPGRARPPPPLLTAGPNPPRNPGAH
jgi:hypothetical protein